ncbi:MAG: chemotaxis-specific protein-glutamate methyltransferase CheB [Mangrovibacterium sp.]
MGQKNKIRVLVVDDSAGIREILTSLLEQDTAIVVLKAVADPYEAAGVIAEEVPDVITLDLEMPRMGGLIFLEKLMNQHPIPVVIVSSFTAERRELGIRALALGAAEVVTKSGFSTPAGLEHFGMLLRNAVRAASMQNVNRHRFFYRKQNTKGPKADLFLSGPSADAAVKRIILIGASTGGTGLIAEMLKALRTDLPPILIVQHMPGEFTKSYADRLNADCALPVKEAGKNERLRNGHVYVANGFSHLIVKQVGEDFFCDLLEEKNDNLPRPSVDRLFHSVAVLHGLKVLAVLLTGMGVDGAVGMLELKERGAFCVAQDEKSCAVYGMPREAVRLNAASLVGNPQQIIGCINRFR